MINSKSKNLFSLTSKYSKLALTPVSINAAKYNYATHLVKQGKQKVVGRWLFICAAGVLGMIVLGGYTRLSHSGLSMADWSPYTKRYPKTQAQWNEEFQKYKQCIEFQTVNKNITLEEFKPIYNVQFAHRALGMGIGYMFMLPLATFWYKGYFTTKMKGRLAGLLALGGMQGFIGWWMVKSGLKEKPDYQNRPRVSPYRLATHLMMATTIYAGLIWNSFSLLIKPVQIDPSDISKLKYLRKIRVIGILMTKFLLLNILSGAFVAGIDAGKVYNTWPLMNDQVIPPTAFDLQPFWKNFIENKALVQFNHRTMAYLTESMSIYLLYTVFKHKISSPATMAAVFAFSMINYQAISGILVLMNLVPSQKANMHQMTAIITLTSVLLMVYLSKGKVIPIIPK